MICYELTVLANRYNKDIVLYICEFLDPIESIESKLFDRRFVINNLIPILDQKTILHLGVLDQIKQIKLTNNLLYKGLELACKYYYSDVLEYFCSRTTHLVLGYDKSPIIQYSLDIYNDKYIRAASLLGIAICSKNLKSIEFMCKKYKCYTFDHIIKKRKTEIYKLLYKLGKGIKQPKFSLD